MVKTMESPDEFTGPVNLGNPVECSMQELAETVIRLTGSKSNIEYKPLPDDDPKHRRPDITLAKKELAWEPRTDLETGLTKTIEYFDRKLSQKD
jgi:UDP-glucuronate decarboxylase